ncbi:hypothetical protein [Bacteroides sp.]|uniref:hypothetical protein n=1 Tax=Bacteroides sp. TaxID=29523 RepID=UPI003AB2B55B
MTAKKTDYIIIYSFLCASILSIAVLVRLFVVTELKMDEFSGLVAFIVTCLLLGSIYFSFQSILNDCLLPLVERVLKSKEIATFEPVIITQGQEDITKSIDESITQSTVLSVNYENYKTATQHKIEAEQSRILENVLHYTHQELSFYMEEANIKQLCEHIRFFQFATEKECEQINTPVIVDTKLKSIDLMHFGWNIGNQFKKSGIETATFIKQVFATPFENVEISTIKRKLRVEGTCKIKLAEEIEPII